VEERRGDIITCSGSQFILKPAPRPEARFCTPCIIWCIVFCIIIADINSRQSP